MIEAISMLPAALSAQKEWRIKILLAFFLGGVGGGLFLFSQYFQFMPGVVLSLIIIGVGKNGFHLWYLGRPQKFYRALLRPHTSWISRGFISIVLFLIFALLYAAPSLVSGLPWTSTGPLGSAFRITASCAAFFLMIYTGFVMSVSPSIPFWNTAMLPVMFMMYGLIGGLDLIFIAASLGMKGAFHLGHLEMLQIAFMLVTLFFLLGYLVIMYNSSPAGKGAVKMLCTGTMGILFLGGVVGIGLMVPLFIMGPAFFTGSSSPAVAGAAGFLTLAGGLLFRWSVLRAGLYLPLL